MSFKKNLMKAMTQYGEYLNIVGGQLNNHDHFQEVMLIGGTTMKNFVVHGPVR